MKITNREQLDELIKNRDSIYLYGIGNWGEAIADYLIENGHRDKIAGIVVSELEWNPVKYKGVAIQKYETDILRGRTVLICMFHSADICQKLEIERMEYYTFETLSFLPNDPDDPQVIKSRVKDFTGLDFVIAGFAKCGTSTLHDVMRKNRDLCLPKQKETFYYMFKDSFKDPKQHLAAMFGNGPFKHQLVGSADPSFYCNAKELYEDFGENLKVILTMRNPVNAVFSSFRNSLRRGDRVELYKKYPTYSPEMFDIFCEKVLNRSYPFYYDQWVREFVEIFGINKVHIVLFEELVREPQRIIQELYDFLGVENKYYFYNLPRKNEGNEVPATREGLLVANKKTELVDWGRKHPDKHVQQGEEFRNLQKEYNAVPKIRNLVMEEYQKEKLKEMFSDSVRNLESIIDRDLSAVWF